jgi:DNA ligase-1
MEFEAFAERAGEIEAASADGEITALVADLLADADEDLAVVARFVQGRPFPAWAPETLEVGPALCYEALARAAGPDVDADDVEARVAETGDVGAAAASYDLGGQRGLAAFGESGSEDALRVAGVAEEFERVADAGGAGSEDRKRDALFGLFNRCSPAEARYLARLVLGEMRIGVGEGTVRDAVPAAFDVPAETVAAALQVRNDCGEVAEVAREEGEDGLAALELTVGRPVQAMLAQAGTVTEAVEAWEAVATEVKYDGARVQLHHDGTDVSVYSRNMEDVTAALPEVVEFAEEHLAAPAIVDGEVVAVDDDGEVLPFQNVLRRFRRKHEVERMREEVAVELRAFDCLHAPREKGGDDGQDPRGEDLLDAPLTERRERLAAVLDGGLSTFEVLEGVEAVERVEREALAAGHEGVMLKNPDSAYTPGRRGKQWLKRKPDVETLDLVVTGAEWGEGRRAELLGTYLLSARTDDDFETVGKVATGVTDEQLDQLHERLEPHVVGEDGKTVDVEPAVVFEVGYEEIQPSPTYSSGYALRFPRFVAVREDRAPGDADSVERVERLAEDQAGVGG